MILGLDVSHHNAVPSMAAAKAAGRDFCVIKATEGTSFADPSLAAYRAQAHAAGMIVGLYQFADVGDDPLADARWFLKNVGTVQPGEFLVLDWEVSAPNPPAWCQTWLDAVHAATGVAPLIYMNQSAVNGYNWSSVAKTYGLWLAKYDNAPAAQNAVPYWGVPAMKQYSDAGSVLGVSGGVDVDSFFGTTSQLRAYGQPAPTPTPPGDNMALTAEEHAWLEDVLRRVQSIHRYGFLPIPADSVKNPVPPWTAGGDLAWLDARQKDVVAQVAAALPASQAPQVDPAALAAALLADEASVAKLGDAIAAGLAKRVGNG